MQIPSLSKKMSKSKYSQWWWIIPIIAIPKYIGFIVKVIVVVIILTIILAVDDDSAAAAATAIISVTTGANAATTATTTIEFIIFAHVKVLVAIERFFFTWIDWMETKRNANQLNWH